LSYPPEEALKHLRAGLGERAEAGAKQLRVFADVDTAIAARRQANGLSEGAARALVERGVEACVGGWRWSSDPRLTVASPLRISETQILAVLAGIECPTLLVLAEPHAPYLAPERMSQRVAQVRRIKVTRVAGSHHLHLEDPEPVARAIAGFRSG
jgi:pimeloyl-ACP methyl ester carboxylesterase